MHCGTMMYRDILSGGKEEGCGWLSTGRCGAMSRCLEWLGEKGSGGQGKRRAGAWQCGAVSA